AEIDLVGLITIGFARALEVHDERSHATTQRSSRKRRLPRFTASWCVLFVVETRDPDEVATQHVRLLEANASDSANDTVRRPCSFGSDFGAASTQRATVLDP